MNIEDLRDFCLSLPGSEESLPFGPDVLVFKVGNKMFLLASLESEILQFNVKCEPEEAIALREQYSCVLPGYHMNKKHWNTIIIDGSVPIKQVHTWILSSYQLIVSSIPKLAKKGVQLHGKSIKK